MTNAVQPCAAGNCSAPNTKINAKTAVIGVGTALGVSRGMLTVGQKAVNTLGDTFTRCGNLLKESKPKGIAAIAIAGVGTICTALLAIQDKDKDGKSDLLEAVVGFFR